MRIPVDLTNCDREPIHQLGAIQPFGFLLALGDDWRIERASENVDQHLGQPLAEVLGRSVTEIFDQDAIHTLRNMAAMLRTPDAVERGHLDRLTPSGGAFDVAVHLADGLFILECEPADGGRGDASALVRAMISRVRPATSLKGFLEEGARQVRALTGFDRVMIYRFDAAGSGEVAAEARRSSVDSFLGLNYPASDIPAQARLLYVRNTFRVIADVGAPPALIVPQFDVAGAPLDLSMSLLRSVSPIHIEYLRNMGVAASLSISILVEGRLWGLVACHHYAPKRPSMMERTAAELFGSMFSLMLESRLRAQEAEYEVKAREVASHLLATIARDGSAMADSSWFGSTVADAIPCDGVGVMVDGVSRLSGLTPDEAQFSGIITWLNRAASSQIYTTDQISSVIPEAAAYGNKAAGMLAIPISRTARDHVVLFRAERLRAVRWAGNPEKPVELGPLGARLTPRKSFEEWSELVKGKAEPFTAAELRVAESLRGALLEVVLRLADAAGDERRRAQERQTLLVAELNHRVRNILALIRGLVAQTRQHAVDPNDMMETLDLRVQALARAHDQVSADRLAPASLTSLIATEVSAFLGARRDRVRLEGEDVKLVPDAFTVVALVVHELVTNAAKYGALSQSGTVTIRWHLDNAGDLRLSWSESGGPAVTAPRRRGFGTTVIERSIPHELGGSADMRYRVSGIEAEFRIPARHVSAATPRGAPARIAAAPARKASPYEGSSVLLVEDSLMIALGCEATLLELGAREVLVAASVPDAMALIADRTVDVGVLDFNLGETNSLPIADELKARGVPMIFASGYGDALALPPAHASAPVIVKPYTHVELANAGWSAMTR
ncbi:HWE histidine kinase domain-containing protein [Xanthobacter tagetidis]|uniref:Blue-light-activated histidine kinase n=1 Tax=Xanthobacter tagetidis TaxID=60216 RepID=A0A3L6ZZZ7_9HYPH|nr:HWE histidine kinase domain-containing protein [Xanthobacter tagetidis]MBB6307079.1 light-regulated signal transduction histidine kinase (bacteriophytochrome) [Xanthobacter tagetidis]RLP73275.1 GAF domain-containing protein [Xanthobacter tagetidis]